jgi:hypothetical protein
MEHYENVPVPKWNIFVVFWLLYPENPSPWRFVPVFHFKGAK